MKDMRQTVAVGVIKSVTAKVAGKPGAPGKAAAGKAAAGKAPAKGKK